MLKRIKNFFRCLIHGHEHYIRINKTFRDCYMLHVLFCGRCNKTLASIEISAFKIWNYQDEHRYIGGKKAGVRPGYDKLLDEWLYTIRGLDPEDRNKLIKQMVKFARNC